MTRRCLTRYEGLAQFVPNRCVWFLYVCFSTNINVALFLKGCIFAPLIVRLLWCSDLHPIPWGSDMRCSTVKLKPFSLGAFTNKKWQWNSPAWLQEQWCPGSWSCDSLRCSALSTVGRPAPRLRLGTRSPLDPPWTLAGRKSSPWALSRASCTSCWNPSGLVTAKPKLKVNCEGFHRGS